MSPRQICLRRLCQKTKPEGVRPSHGLISLALTLIPKALRLSGVNMSWYSSSVTVTWSRGSLASFARRSQSRGASTRSSSVRARSKDHRERVKKDRDQLVERQKALEVILAAEGGAKEPAQQQGGSACCH